MAPFASLSSSSNKRKPEGGHDEQPFKKSAGTRSFWMVQYRAPQQKKHKTWDDDGVLEVVGARATLWDMTNQKITDGPVKDADSLCEGSPLFVGGKELEIDCAVSRDDFLSGKCFGRGNMASAVLPALPPATKTYAPPRPMGGGSTKSKPFVQLESVNLVAHFNSDSLRSRTPPPLQALETSYWTVTWRKVEQTKKNKTWEGDAFLSMVGTTATLIGENGKQLGSRTWNDSTQPGQIMHISGREIQLGNRVKRVQLPSLFGGEDTADGSQSQTTDHESVNVSVVETKAFVPPAAFYGKKQRQADEPLHDPKAEGAIIMRAPSKEHQQVHNKRNNPIVSVVIDPYLARHLRPHQVEGVKFMYESVMGMRAHEGFGCILADEMGMGKSLQTITLIWTLLKQNPYSSRTGSVGKVLVVCPVTLLNNWKKEFNKWLGRDRLNVFVGDKDKAVIKQFLNSKAEVLIIGYEKLRTVISDLAYCVPPIGLIVCDEGHRLKSANNKSNKMFEALRTKRRVILSGTPIQNDLGEFHAMADFCNPGLLDDYNTFRKIYEAPILKSRAPGCSKKDLEEGEARSARLHAIAQSFVLRREAGILSNYLPPKHEYTVFVSLTELQQRMFSVLLADRNINRLTHSHTANALAMIRTCTKLSTSPMLLKHKPDARDEAMEDAISLIPGGTASEDMSISGKLLVVDQLLTYLVKHTEEKVILVSHFTSTLNVIESYCKKKRYNYHRLDGQTQSAKRQEHVDHFNRTSQKQCFLFLLSTKAGGVGLNLVGASRLVLIDSDWNPSHDLQAMARIHRDGQKKPVFIYRLLSTGTIDEKIFQRQVTKLGLSDSLMKQGQVGGAPSKTDSFSAQELRDLFTVHSTTDCNTHDLLMCTCHLNKDDEDINADEDDHGDDSSDEEQHPGFVVASTINPKKLSKADKNRRKADLQSLAEWMHISCLSAESRETIRDEALRSISATSCVQSLRATADNDSAGDTVSEDNRGGDKSIPCGVISFLFEKSSL
ncbi:P-loop containing nucleoside triphosphate hydrolase protein [Auriculariales sp. MPI-PUGE-AT-0066]|nr:P-loop containing nucleoside triphosphate hydrolase protein [Auriculariales sp. MPI-PUGE-AT-0066]